MDAKIKKIQRKTKKIEKSVKSEEKDLSRLLKADKKNDAKMDRLKKMKKGKC